MEDFSDLLLDAGQGFKDSIRLFQRRLNLATSIQLTLNSVR